MIGLPTEDGRGRARHRRDRGARAGDRPPPPARGAQVTASVSTHVPKPHTPFQWAAMDTRGGDRAQAGAAGRARRARCASTSRCTRTTQSHIEGIFSRGDRRGRRPARGGVPPRLPLRQLGRRAAHRPVGAGDRGDARRAPVSTSTRYLGTLPVTARLPWDHIDIGLEPDFLAKEYRKALKDRLSPPCGKPYKKLLHPSSVAAAEAGAQGQADLLRLRHRLRPRRHEERAALSTCGA